MEVRVATIDDAGELFALNTLTTHTDNRAAQALYEKLGYKKNGEILMEKDA